MGTEVAQKSCFVIAPIGAVGSDVRRRSDLILEHVIAPGVGRFGYVPVRADKIAEPGLITNQVIQRVVQDPLVVADLTGANPNVFYELALRHALRKPVVLIADAGQVIPFDIAGARAVLVHGLDIGQLQDAADELARSIEILEQGYRVVDSPVSVALGLRSATDCAALGIQSGDEHDPFAPPRVWAYPVREDAYAHAARVIRETPPSRAGRQQLLLAALHGHTTKRIPSPSGSAFGSFDEAVLERAHSPHWVVHELLNIASESRLDRVIARIEGCKDADGYEVRAFCMPGALPQLSPLVVGTCHLFLGLEDPRFNRVAAMVHIESSAAVDLAVAYFATLWEDRRTLVLRSRVEAQHGAIDEIRRRLRQSGGSSK
ncbi:MAG TPA: hypothetical protein ENG96_01865 [Gammaproteobacteria bacterium]|nr:hypothetical protein [Gammaproteobacteria bacterium]